MTANRLPVTQEYLKEFMTEFMSGFMLQFMADFMPKVLQPIYTRLDQIDATLMQVKNKLEEHDDLLETIAAEVSHDQDEIHEFAGVRKDHERRIMHLERGFMKYMINS